MQSGPQSFSYNVMQKNSGLILSIVKLKFTHVQTVCESHDLNIAVGSFDNIFKQLQ